ncbi:NAT10-containing [Ictidomys tridecemlineatus]|uniref:RNA cytidine acetyltransferase pseudogene n=1 Tax=Ictidomys tridecemlineatus TaxID=43179 RepID=A0A287D4C3_ICTTR|nr:NAT10-containing [Ictidomys tridecemlineatus]
MHGKKILIENGVAKRQRSLFVVVGDHGKDQVVILHHMLSKATVKARPSKELGFSSHRKKRMRQLQKKIKNGTLNIKQDDHFELFVAATNIRYCHYNETHKILGNTFGMCVLQDFEVLTPNLLPRTVETVEGGGLQLYTMTMDVHSRYRTEAHQDIRFIFSLASCKKFLVMNDQLNILPISSHIASIEALPPQAPDENQSFCSGAAGVERELAGHLACECVGGPDKKRKLETKQEPKQNKKLKKNRDLKNKNRYETEVEEIVKKNLGLSGRL